MEDKNCNLLFNYLKSILYDSKVESLDLDLLDEPYLKLGRGLKYLETAVTEMKEYSANLSKGTLSGFTPERGNPLTENLKNVHSNLTHLTWQAKQVAKGDYSQTVSYLGEFSESFNLMTRQLKEREERLKHEAEIQKEHAQVVQSYNQLLLDMINRSDEEIFVTSKDSQDVLYRSQHITDPVSESSSSEMFLEHLAKENVEDLQSKEVSERTWEIDAPYRRFYKVTTGLMEWQGEQAYAHIIREVTEEKEREERLTDEAYRDNLTGIGNRCYFEDKSRELLAEGEALIFCYCDLDHLKYINDTYGHPKGDWYLKNFTEIINAHIRSDDIFARIGGDEFCIILRNCKKTDAKEKIAQMQSAFSIRHNKEYPKSFSCGITEVPQGHAETMLEDIIQEADHIMYKQKLIHKKFYNREL